MTIHSFALHKIDPIGHIVHEQPYEQNDILEEYIRDILDKVTAPDDKRVYDFSKGSLVEPEISKMLDTKLFQATALNSSNRLLTIENTAQHSIEHLTEIQRGILIQAVVEIEDEMRVILSKADFNEYLSENSNLKPDRGLPMKRKIYKAFCASFNRKGELIEIFVFDPYNTKYWWREFLELKQSNTDESNTEKAFGAIDAVLQRFKSNFPADHNIVRNNLVGYFKSKQRQFSMTGVKKKMFDNYVPIDINFPIEKIKEKLDGLPSKNKFDSQFTVIPEKITAKKLREIIPLTDKMELHVKDYIQNLEADVTPIKYQGQKFIRIRTDSGYKAFGGEE